MFYPLELLKLEACLQFFFLNLHLLAFFATVILTSGSLRMLKTISKLFIFVSLLLQTERIFVILSKI
jgi:hypothetical protein